MRAVCSGGSRPMPELPWKGGPILPKGRPLAARRIHTP